jgi:hypothetical protein
MFHPVPTYCFLSKAAFLGLSSQDNLSWINPGCGACCMCCRIFGSTLVFYPLDTGSTPLQQLMTINYIFKYCPVFLRRQSCSN